MTPGQMHDIKLNTLLSVLTSSQWGQHTCAILLRKFRPRRNLHKGCLTLGQVSVLIPSTPQESEIVSYSVMSKSLRPHGLQPTRLLCPWDPPGTNTGVGCHALLQGIFPGSQQVGHDWSDLACRDWRGWHRFLFLVGNRCTVAFFKVRNLKVHM